MNILNGWKSNSIAPSNGLLINTTNYYSSGSNANFHAVDSSLGNYRPVLTITYNVEENADINEDVTYIFATSDYNRAMQISNDNSCIQNQITYKTQSDKTYNKQLFQF